MKDIETNLVGRTVKIYNYDRKTGAETVNPGGEVVGVYLNKNEDLRFLINEGGRIVTRLQQELIVVDLVRVFNKLTGNFETVEVNAGPGISAI